MTGDALFSKTLKAYNQEINEDFLRSYAAELEKQPIFDSCGWSFLGLFAQDCCSMDVRQEFHDRATQQSSKPYGCVLCGEKAAAKYHICAGKVCDDCFATLPGGD